MGLQGQSGRPGKRCPVSVHSDFQKRRGRLQVHLSNILTLSLLPCLLYQGMYLKRLKVQGSIIITKRDAYIVILYVRRCTRKTGV